MAIRKHNRALISISIFIALILAIIFYQSRNLFLEDSANNLTDNLTDNMTENLHKSLEVEAHAMQTAFAEIIGRMNECFQLKASIPPEISPQLDSLVLVLQPQFGLHSIRDKAMSWQFRTEDGAEKRLQIKIITNDDGKPLRQAELFSIDAQGTEVRLEFDPAGSQNPTDAFINSFLKNVEVLQKHKTLMVEFTGGGRITAQEQSEQLLSFEIEKNLVLFRCHSLKSEADCQCLQLTSDQGGL